MSETIVVHTRRPVTNEDLRDLIVNLGGAVGEFGPYLQRDGVVAFVEIRPARRVVPDLGFVPASRVAVSFTDPPERHAFNIIWQIVHGWDGEIDWGLPGYDDSYRRWLTEKDRPLGK